MPLVISNLCHQQLNNMLLIIIKILELKKIEDSFASAANYLNKIGWKKKMPCFFKVRLKDNIPKKYLNFSSRK